MSRDDDAKNKRSIVVIKVGTSSLLKTNDGCVHLSAALRAVRDGDRPQASRISRRARELGRGGGGDGENGDKTLGDEAVAGAQTSAGGDRATVLDEVLHRRVFVARRELRAGVADAGESVQSHAIPKGETDVRAAMFELGAIPVVNENDTVAVEELRFGDNDTLSAQVAALVEAQYLFLLTDVDGLYTSNPASDPAAKKIETVEDINALDVDVNSGAGSNVGTGGMVTKLTAARIASAAGCQTVICLASVQGTAIMDVLAGKSGIGTRFLAAKKSARGKKRWLLSVPIKGEVRVDEDGAKAVLNGMALMVSKCVAVEGTFGVQESVRILDEHGAELGRGLSNYTIGAMRDFLQRGPATSDDEWEDDLDGPPELIHSNNVCITNAETLAKSFVLRNIGTYGSMMMDGGASSGDDER